MAAIIVAPFVFLGKSALYILGFSAAGPMFGTLAAGWQATMGGVVAAGSIFAMLQSAAMGGATAVAAMLGVGVAGFFATFLSIAGILLNAA
jgi:hypothetical protein